MTVMCSASHKPFAHSQVNHYGEQYRQYCTVGLVICRFACVLKTCSVVQVTWRTPGVYVPQLGDDVVYLQVGHRKFLSANNNKLQGPWDSIVSTAVRYPPLLYNALFICSSLPAAAFNELCIDMLARWVTSSS